MIIEYFFVIAFGLIIGSFLNVVLLRHNTGQSLAGRSGCMSCAKKLHWYELVPVLSYILLRGKCNGCKSKISSQYPLVETATAVLFLLVYLSASSIHILANGLIISALFVLIAVYDARHTIIPNEYVYPFMFFAFAMHVPDIVNGTISQPFFAVAEIIASGVILALPFAALWWWSKGEWIGLGDAKLLLGIGFLLGLSGGVAALATASIVGSIVGICGIIYSKYQAKKLKLKKEKVTLKTEIPFGPFLILGTVLVWLLHFDILYYKLMDLSVFLY